jgi:hypothetical protein
MFFNLKNKFYFLMSFCEKIFFFVYPLAQACVRFGLPGDGAGGGTIFFPTKRAEGPTPSGGRAFCFP